MFMSADMFDDEGPKAASPRPPQLSTSTSSSNLTRPLSSSQSQPSQSPASSTSFSSSQSITNIATFDGEGQALTPAMRKQKMEELRLQQLGKRKGRMLVPTVVAKNDRPTAASTASAASSTGSRPTTASSGAAKPGLGGAGGGGTGYHSFNRTNSSIMDLDEKDDDPTAPRSSAERDMIAAGISPIFDPNPHRAPPATSSSSSSSAGATSPSSTGLAAGPSSPFSLTSLSPLSLRLFLTSPCSPHHHHQCYITRNKKGIANRLYPLYHCTYEQGERTIMSARKRAKNKTSNYTVTAESGDEMIGKVRSNFVGTEFSVYDDGVNPEKLKPAGDGAEGGEKEKRAELATVLYESNILGSRGPRKMTVLIPAVKQSKDGKQVAAVHRPGSTHENDSLLHHYKQASAAGTSTERFTALVNKTPRWNEQVGAYVLNFNGRVTMASVKNFQLMVHTAAAEGTDSAAGDDGEEGEERGGDGGGGADEKPCLQFGRVGKDMFTMDFGWPLSPLQAFSICLSSFDYKLACE